MDKRNEYRVVPNYFSPDRWEAQYRQIIFQLRAFGGGWQWTEWESLSAFPSPEEAEACCRRHAGEGTKYLGRLP